MVNARNGSVGYRLAAPNLARCTVARSLVKKLAWDTGLKSMPKITTALRHNGDHIIVEIVEFPHQGQYRKPFVYLDRASYRRRQLYPHSPPSSDDSAGEECAGASWLEAIVCLTDKLSDGIEAAAKSQTNLNGSIGLCYDISKIEDTSAHRVKFRVSQFAHRALGEFMYSNHNFLLSAEKSATFVFNLSLSLVQLLT
jgi:hypothetical protein